MIPNTEVNVRNLKAEVKSHFIEQICRHAVSSYFRVVDPPVCCCCEEGAFMQNRNPDCPIHGLDDRPAKGVAKSLR